MTLAIAGAARYTLGQPPQVLLTVTSTTGTPNATPDNSILDVFRIHTDGTTHRVLTNAFPRVSGGTWTWLDSHLPYNAPVIYQVTAAGNTVSSSPVSVATTLTWLVHPVNPSLSQSMVATIAIGDRGYASRAVRFQPIAAPPVFLSYGLRDGVSGSIDFTIPPSQVSALVGLLADDAPILINTPGGQYADITWQWCQPGKVAISTPGGVSKSSHRFVSVPFESCDDPDVDSTPISCATAATFASTCSLYSALYANCGTASTDTRL